MEYIDIYDENNNPLEKSKEKTQAHEEGDFHRTAHIWIINENKELLLQKRSANKVFYPNLWSIFVKGHIKSGESSIDACIRELKEEIAINVKKEELIYIYTIKEEKTKNDYIERIFFDTYMVKKTFNLDDLVIQKEELSEIKLLSFNEILSLINNNNESLVPNFEDYKRLVKIIR